MSTAPAPAPSINWAALLPIFELAGNITLSALGANGVISPNYAAIATAIEGGINPLIAAVKAGSATSTDVYVALGSLVAAVNVLKNQTGLSPAVLSRLSAYGAAAQAAMVGYQQGALGFDPSKLTPVTPIV